MILAIDAHKLSKDKQTGTDAVLTHFIANLTPELTAPFKQVILYSHITIPAHFLEGLPENVTTKIVSFPFFWTTIGLSLEFIFHPPDVFFTPSHLFPLRIPLKSAIIIHDIGYLKYPENYSARDLFYLKRSIPGDIKRASLVFTPSEYVKKSLIDTFYTDPNKIHTAWLAVDVAKFQERLTPELTEKTLTKYDDRLVGRPYILFLGRVDYRKNILNILKAFLEFKQKTKHPHVLVLAGKPGVGYPEFVKFITDNKLEEDVVLTDYVSEIDKPTLFQEAELFLFPSLYEGFGIPVLESQASRTAVITAKTSCLPEVAGEGALLVNSENVSEITDAIRKIIDNPALKQKLIDKGFKNVDRFNWANFTTTIMRLLTKLGKRL